jgi:hypothetical protein
MTTHAQALARIEDEIKKASDWFDSADDIYTAQSVIDEENVHLRFMLTLKAVLELHGPDEDGNCGYCTPWRKYEGEVPFPCRDADLIIKGVLG